MSVEARIQRRIEGKARFPAKGTRPPGWPSHMRCPKCQAVMPTGTLLFFARPAEAAPKLNRVVGCPQTGCGHVYSPTPEYLQDQEALTEQGEAAGLPQSPGDVHGHAQPAPPSTRRIGVGLDIGDKIERGEVLQPPLDDGGERWTER